MEDAAAATKVVNELGNLPYLFIGGYLVMLLVIGYIGYRRSVTASEEDYYLAGRNQGWIVTSLTIMATFFSSAALLGVPGSVYKEGVVFTVFALNVPLSGALVYVFGSRISRLGRAKGYVTQADMISDYYDSPVALRLLTALVGFLYAVPYIVMQIRAGGIISQQMFNAPHAFEIGSTALAVIMMVYIIVGGMRSVALADVVQGTLLMIGMVLGGISVVWALGGIGGFFEAVSKLPTRSLSAPGTTGVWGPEKLFTVCLFAALGSIIQPAQWMRFYAARSVGTLRRSALIFAIVLTSCYIFGVMLVGIAGQALYPIAEDGKYRVEAVSEANPGESEIVMVDPDTEDVNWSKLMPHPKVGKMPGEFDQVMVVCLKDNLPKMLGAAGTILIALILTAITAAAMSTADSNLHALSGLLTRDVYDRFINPKASDRGRTWVGRGVIAGTTIIALMLVITSRHSARFNPIAMLIPLLILAVAFSSQLLPVTIDMLFIRRGSRAGAVAGVVTGIVVVFMFSPFSSVFTEQMGMEGVLSSIKRVVDIGTCGFVCNVVVFIVVSLFTKRPERGKIKELADLMTGRGS